jgi:hypothetical protein
MVSPGIGGSPLVMTRSGSPAVWASIVVILCQLAGGIQSEVIISAPQKWSLADQIQLMDEYGMAEDFIPTDERSQIRNNKYQIKSAAA